MTSWLQILVYRSELKHLFVQLMFSLIIQSPSTFTTLIARVFFYLQIEHCVERILPGVDDVGRNLQLVTRSDHISAHAESIFELIIMIKSLFSHILQTTQTVQIVSEILRHKNG